MELQKIYNDERGTVAAFAESRIGGRGENQDSFGWQETDLGYLVTVCDGMGGGPSGKTASSIAVSEIIKGVTEAGKDEEVSNVIIKAIRRANMAIIEAGKDNHALMGMGSTATVLLISKKSAYAAHVGDSRIYQLRGHKKVFRTFDHSMVFEMVAQKVITEEQARLSANSNVITRALGVKPDVEVEIHELPYKKGDRFVLCTDGIHSAMPEEELIRLLSKADAHLGVVTDDIATYIDNLGRTSGGGHDNLTLAMVETKTGSKLKPKTSSRLKAIISGLATVVIVGVATSFIYFNGPEAEPPIMTSDKAATGSADAIQGLSDTQAEGPTVSAGSLSASDEEPDSVNKKSQENK